VVNKDVNTVTEDMLVLDKDGKPITTADIHIDSFKVVGGTGATNNYVVKQNMNWLPVGLYLVNNKPTTVTPAVIFAPFTNFFGYLASDFQALKAYAAGTVSADVLKMFMDTNAVRAAAGDPPLVLDLKLCEAAAIRAQEAIQFWSHTRPDGSKTSTVLQDVGVTSVYGCGENLAMGYLPSDVVNIGWVNSPGHYANLVGGYKTVGAGVAYDSNGVPYCSELFGAEYFEPVDINEATQEPEPVPEDQLDQSEPGEIADEPPIDGEVTEVTSEDSDLGFKDGDQVDTSDLPPDVPVNLPDDVTVITEPPMVAPVITITKQPGGATKTVGATREPLVLTATTDIDGAVLSYQWYDASNNSLIFGANNSTYYTPNSLAVSSSGYGYYCVVNAGVTDEQGRTVSAEPVTSITATIVVKDKPAPVTPPTTEPNPPSQPNNPTPPTDPNAGKTWMPEKTIPAHWYNVTATCQVCGQQIARGLTWDGANTGILSLPEIVAHFNEFHPGVAPTVGFPGATVGQMGQVKEARTVPGHYHDPGVTAANCPICNGQ